MLLASPDKGGGGTENEERLKLKGERSTDNSQRND